MKRLTRYTLAKNKCTVNPCLRATVGSPALREERAQISIASPPVGARNIGAPRDPRGYPDKTTPSGQANDSPVTGSVIDWMSVVKKKSIDAPAISGLIFVV